jgi:hypothetical protein
MRRKPRVTPNFKEQVNKEMSENHREMYGKLESIMTEITQKRTIRRECQKKAK